VKNFISVIMFVFVLFALGYSAGGNAPTAQIVDAIWTLDVDTAYTVGDLDTLDGDDSIRIYPKGGKFKKGYQYIMAFGALSGAQAATAVLQVKLRSYDAYDSLLTALIVDTVVAAGGYIKLPINETIFGHLNKYRIHLQSLTGSDEVVFNNVVIYRRRMFQFDVRNKF